MIPKVFRDLEGEGEEAEREKGVCVCVSRQKRAYIGDGASRRRDALVCSRANEIGFMASA